MHMKQHADDRTKQITESCDEYDRLSSSETVGSQVETPDKGDAEDTTRVVR